MNSYIKVVVLILAGLLVLIPFAASEPDGLEKTVETLGVEETDSTYTGLMADYNVEGVENSFTSTAIAGVTGFLVVLGLGVVLGKSLNKTNKTTKKNNKQGKLLNSHRPIKVVNRALLDPPIQLSRVLFLT